jgi:hypothetical protein
MLLQDSGRPKLQEAAQYPAVKLEAVKLGFSGVYLCAGGARLLTKLLGCLEFLQHIA